MKTHAHRRSTCSVIQTRQSGQHGNLHAQKGFTILELTFVLVVIALLGVLAYPRVTALLIEGRMDPTTRDLSGAVIRIRANAEGTGNTPYVNASTSTLANALRDRTTALTVAGVGNAATVQHRLGTTGSQVLVAPATITTAGDSFAVTFNTTNAAVCPGLATAMQAQAEIISINGTVVARTANAGGAVAFNGQIAQDLCTADNTNTFVFTMR
ncbi:MAG: prepilin-type N-terminal cleavage/methylation domain-containing protein [Rhodoferax sp.]|nr:prepilin-type N-terminal cleavage/methylation domain-containing protein [Rhodoferax sp.]